MRIILVGLLLVYQSVFVCFATFGKEAITREMLNRATSTTDYFEKLAQKINESFEIRLTQSETNRCSVNFSINRKGDLLEMQLQSNSGNADFNQAFQDAILLAAPYPSPSSISDRTYIRANAHDGQVIVGETGPFKGEKAGDLPAAIKRQIERYSKTGNIKDRQIHQQRLKSMEDKSSTTHIPEKVKSPAVKTTSTMTWTGFPEWSTSESSITSKKTGLAARPPLFQETDPVHKDESFQQKLSQSAGVTLLSSNIGTKTDKEIDFSAYMKDLQRRIKRSWFPPRGMESRRVKLVFKIHKNGEMENLRVTESSNVQNADQAAMQAVKNASPFSALPQGAPNTIDVEFTFDYTIHKDGNTN